MAKHLWVRGGLPSDPWVDIGPVSGEADELMVTLAKAGAAVLAETERFPVPAKLGLVLLMKIEEREEVKKPLRLLVQLPGGANREWVYAGVMGSPLEVEGVIQALGGNLLRAAQGMEFGATTPSGMLIDGVGLTVKMRLRRMSDAEVAALPKE